MPKETANKLSNLLSHSKNAPAVRELVAEVRKVILGNEEIIKSTDIILFQPLSSKNEEKEIDTFG